MYLRLQFIRRNVVIDIFANMKATVEFHANLQHQIYLSYLFTIIQISDSTSHSYKCIGPTHTHQCLLYTEFNPTIFFCVFWYKRKVKYFLPRPGQALRVPGVRGSQISRQSANGGAKIVSSTNRTPLLHTKYFDTPFCQRLNRHQDRSVARRIMSMKNSNDKIGKQILVFSTCSAVLLFGTCNVNV